MRSYHPDDSKMFPRDPRGQGGGGGGGGQGLLSPFLPGNKGLLAQQLSQGFGGKPAQYSQHFNQLYQPMPTGFFKPGGGFGGMGGGGGGGNGGGPQGIPLGRDKRLTYDDFQRFFESRGMPLDQYGNLTEEQSGMLRSLNPTYGRR